MGSKTEGHGSLNQGGTVYQGWGTVYKGGNVYPVCGNKLDVSIFDFELSGEEVKAISTAGAPLQPKRVFWAKHGLDDQPRRESAYQEPAA